MTKREAFFNIYAQGMARVATATPKVFPGDPAANAAATAEMAKAAHETGAALLVCPELGLTGYAIDDQLQQDVVLDAAEAAAESPALLTPREGVRVTCWVGAAERPEFVRQNALLANVWTGLGAEMSVHEAVGEHHFDVIDGLAAPDGELCEAVCGD